MVKLTGKGETEEKEVHGPGREVDLGTLRSLE
jgi:hypothetical protein